MAVVAAGFLRVIAFHASSVDAAAISASLFLIVTSSVVLGTVRRRWGSAVCRARHGEA